MGLEQQGRYVSGSIEKIPPLGPKRIIAKTRKPTRAGTSNALNYVCRTGLCCIRSTAVPTTTRAMLHHQNNPNSILKKSTDHHTHLLPNAFRPQALDPAKYRQAQLLR